MMAVRFTRFESCLNDLRQYIKQHPNDETAAEALDIFEHLPPGSKFCCNVINQYITAPSEKTSDRLHDGVSVFGGGWYDLLSN
jgi:hypothetical protein